jgi:hypothetical protein
MKETCLAHRSMCLPCMAKKHATVCNWYIRWSGGSFAGDVRKLYYSCICWMLCLCAPKDVQYVNSTLVHTVLFFFMKKDTVVISNSRQLTGVEIRFARLWDGMDGHIHAHLSGRHGMDQNAGKSDEQHRRCDGSGGSAVIVNHPPPPDTLHPVYRTYLLHYY